MSTKTELVDQTMEKAVNTSLIHRVADLTDCQALHSLINSAYRGESSREGWTTEADFLDGQRVDIQMLTDIISASNNVILLFIDKHEQLLVGCVHVKCNEASDGAYLGMLTVRPDLQSRGYGKLMLSLAEDYIKTHWHVDYIDMFVVTIRHELIAFYNRRGYFDTGRREPFPLDDPRYGLPKRRDLEFCVMRKELKE